jgi:hypothetical protein
MILRSDSAGKAESRISFAGRMKKKMEFNEGEEGINS